MISLLYVGNRLSRHGHTATAIETLGPLLESDNFRVRYTSSKKNKALRFADMIFSTLRYFTQTDYVLIDTYSTQNFWYAVAVSQLCRMFGTKYIPILHGGNLPSRLKNNPRLSAMVFGNAYKNVAPSGYLVEAFQSSGFDVSYIPNPIDVRQFEFNERTKVSPRLLWVRSFAQIYNPEMAIKAFAVIKQQLPNATLCMVGPDAGMLDHIKKIGEELDLDVTFTGRKSREEWAGLSRNYDIFLNTSHVDNAPFSIIEAASLGMAIISTNVGGIPYLLAHRETAMLVADGDFKAMAKAVFELVGDGLLSQRLMANSAKLARDSDWDSVRQKWVEILV